MMDPYPIAEDAEYITAIILCFTVILPINRSFGPLDTFFCETDYLCGRFYPTAFRSHHPWPVDISKNDKGRLSPTLVSRPQKVLDIRTGTGRWAIEFADRNPWSVVSGIDLVHMQDEWVPPNCEFILDDITQQDWCTHFSQVDLVHVGGLGGNPRLLASVLDGAYRCCSPNGVLEIWDSTVQLQDPTGSSDFHIFHREMENAYREDCRSLSLPLCYKKEMERRGFVRVVEYVYDLRLYLNDSESPARKVIAAWAEGFEAYSLDLMVKNLGKRSEEVLVGCAAARQALRKGVAGSLQIRVVSGQKSAVAHSVTDIGI
ncbi:class I SAM-dependent methyltransferase [Aspergillus affinis]|uniref:class I SAM-dependent methyltransferase n=1 Tax=Aspergillus affinis TaxID=1070780 RepID=UPI0022FDFCFB|nr:uncharacterized protein KD926_003179 [Aspergillus affinis]KAI9035639.1 hypothetical protein KD926_003179 [Aspergillus affinis]